MGKIILNHQVVHTNLTIKTIDYVPTSVYNIYILKHQSWNGDIKSRQSKERIFKMFNKKFISAIVFSATVIYSSGTYNRLATEQIASSAGTNQSEVVVTEMAEMNNIKQEKAKTVKYELPDKDTDFKTYMSYRAITNTNSAQYKLQQEAWTDENGLRKIGDDYMIAVGSFYSKHIGDRFKITLDSGVEFTAIVGDLKADKHTGSQHMYTPVYNAYGKFISANVIEFIVDTSSLPSSVRRAGSVGALDDFSGNIKSIEKIKEE